jgi:hypothetical protein
MTDQQKLEAALHAYEAVARDLDVFVKTQLTTGPESAKLLQTIAKLDIDVETFGVRLTVDVGLVNTITIF